MLGYEAQVGVGIDGEGNSGLYASGGMMAGYYFVFGTGINITVNWDAPNLDALSGDGTEMGVLAGPAAGGYSGSKNSSHAALSCENPGGDEEELHGAFGSGGGKGIGVGLYYAGTKTAVSSMPPPGLPSDSLIPFMPSGGVFNGL